MIKVFFRDNVIAKYNSMIEAETEFLDDEEVEIKHYCDICEAVPITENNTICTDCEKGIHIDLFA